jgi:hypothetical protein
MMDFHPPCLMTFQRISVPTSPQPQDPQCPQSQPDFVCKGVNRSRGRLLRSKHMLEKELELVHATKDEEILWLADLLASSRSDALCHPKKGEYFSYLAHRVREIRKVRV